MHREFDHLESVETFPPIPGMSASLVRALNHWRLRQAPPLTAGQAVLSLLTLALTVEGHLVLGQALSEPEEDVQVERFAAVMRELARK